MKIGTSLGKCVKSILDGTVREQDVLLIVANTRCPDLASLDVVIEAYHAGYAGASADYDMSDHSLEDAKAVAHRLMTAGKIHQPRVVNDSIGSFSGRAHNLRDTWYDIVPSNTNSTPAVVLAYEQYQMLAALTK